MKKINLGQKDLIHFVGIGGIGMSGLAQIMKNMGFRVQGSDQNRNKNTKSCSKLGIKIFVGHSPGNIKKVNILTALIYLNIAPLHHYPYSIFLFYLGKLTLHDAIKDKSKF